MFKAKRAIYEALPIPLQRSVNLVPFSFIAGKPYRDTMRRRKWLDRASRNEVLEYQEQELGKLLQFASQYVPAYKHLQCTVERLSPFEALKAFPIVDKETVQQSFDEFVPDIATGKYYETTTGGTGSNPLTIQWDNESQSREMAHIHRFMRQWGYSLRERKATFRGVEPPSLKPGVFWWANPVHNELRYSVFHMDRTNLPVYVDRIIRHRPSYLHGYPSAISILAGHILEEGLSSNLPPIKAVFLTSEACTDFQRERIETAFNARVASWYGHTERLIFGGECEYSQTYHHPADYGVLEIIDEAGNSCDDEGQRGELVGTGLYNYCMPLIRYRTDDYAERLDHKCRCGRQWDRFTNVEAHRKQDMLIGYDGAQIPLTALRMPGSVFENVLRYQYFQDTPGVCIVNLMAGTEFTEEDTLVVQKAYQDKAKGSVDFQTQIVSDIPLTSRGKLKLLDSRLDEVSAS